MCGGDEAMKPVAERHQIIPRPNHQTGSRLQFSKSHSRMLSWSLDIEVSLGFGVWDLGFSDSPP
jgi:hypothetical protein